MSIDSELFIFIRELGKLIDEYYNCPQESIKENIHQDILLLCSVIGGEQKEHYS